MNPDVHAVPLVRAGIDTYRHPVVYMHKDCHLCRAEGFTSLTRVAIMLRQKTVIASLNVATQDDWLAPDIAALSDAAWESLGAREGDKGIFGHAEPAASTSAIRAKVYGERLSKSQFADIIDDTLAFRLSELDLAAFITSCAGDRLDVDETIALTEAMQAAGKTLDWGEGLVLDKHCVGGLPGNRTTPIVVAIVAAAGFRIPKTSSRAITSPAGTADAMEVMTPVALKIDDLKRVVDAEGGCLAWGGELDLSPADDLLIRIERPLDFDSDGQLVASVLSKKAAAGSTHVLIDIPVGPTAKVRSMAAALSLSQRMQAVASALGLTLQTHISDGQAPVGRGIGPALEAHDVLAVLRGDRDAPVDLRERALDLSAQLLDLAQGNGAIGMAQAVELLNNGDAYQKFLAICESQGGFTEPALASFHAVEVAPHDGKLLIIDNRRIARIAKLAGAPGRKTAGVLLCKRPGDHVRAGEPLYEIHAETSGELDWARDYARSGPYPLLIGDQA